MPTVDVVSKLDLQEIDNAVNTVKKEIENRYDFRGANTELELNKGDKTIRLVVADDMKLRAVKEMLGGRFIARKVSPKVLDYGKEEAATLGAIRIIVKLREGLTTDDARAVVKTVKDSKMKVQAAIQGDQVRLTATKIDDLQTIMQKLREDDSISVPVQFVNMKR